MAFLAAKTKKILLGSGIMHISAGVPAMTALTLSALSAKVALVWVWVAAVYESWRACMALPITP